MTQELVDEYKALKNEIAGDLTVSEGRLEIIKQLKKKLESIEKEFEYGLPTSMKECAFICSKIYDILEIEN